MKLKWQLTRIFLVNLFALALIIIVVLYPRHLNITVDQYMRHTYDATLNVELYKSNIVGFFNGIVENKSLGTTRYDRTVEEELLIYLPRSLEVIVAALLLSTILGILKGLFDYRMSKKKKDFLGNGTTWLFLSIPDFLFILLALWFIVFHYPSIPFFTREGWDAFVLPTLFVAIYPTMYIARITSASLASQDGKLYIQVAKAKGLTDQVILYKHMFMNSISTILTHLPSLMLLIISNLLLVEFFMDYQGVAQRLFMAINYSVNYGTGNAYEPELIIGIAFCFILIMFIVQVISQIVTRDKREKTI
ncbi:ABC transporter permease subunit [Bacillus horti]|uniref:ABC-type dipeptide/oligopeptide/nickel transport system permease component n=1 Tax=Caldalkalibacillus horti TaxID=77523 RepID=A0ABT9W345_9BACI|nr:ABC transporter permease subunit [Bacillus horti]MDQ0167265.1 ABC-type dipeptide/oligopeptide/nickel transport system permease component [Bacillus horti]